MRSKAVGLEVERVCSSVEWAALGGGGAASGSTGAGETKVAESPWGHSRTAGVSRVVVEIVESPGVKVGFGGGGVVGGSTAGSVGLVEAEAAAGIAERAEVQGHVERKVVVGSWPVVGTASTVAQDCVEEAGERVVDAGIGRTVVDVGVAAGASRIGYRHSRSSRTEQTAQREDAVAGLAGGDSIASYKLRS